MLRAAIYINRALLLLNGSCPKYLLLKGKLSCIESLRWFTESLRECTLILRKAFVNLQ